MRTFFICFIFSVFSSFLFGQIEDSVYVSTEVPAQYYGGTDSLIAYLSRSVNYPWKSLMDLTEGTAIVHFVIERNGRIGEVWIEKSVSPEIDQESMRVIREMPNWKPAIHNGSTVRSLNILPLKYSLDSQKAQRKKSRNKRKRAKSF